MTPGAQTLPAGDVIRRRVMHERWDGGHRALHEYQRRVEEAIDPGMSILHAGCGWDKHRITEPHGADCTVVGVDLDPRVGPMFHGEFLLADLADLPLEDDRFDVIVSEYVLEHVQDPVKTFREFSRVLRPGGRAIVLTPNLYSYKTLAARFTSHRVHEAAGRIRYGPGQEEEMYPTVFRCNTSERFRSVADQADLEIDSVTFVTNGPTWFQRVPVLFEIGHLFHRAIDRWRFSEQLRCAMIVELTKPEREIRTRNEPASNRRSS
jgi:ubiquinone/menaquinone biosynthesis C-methylase UbiE